MIVYQGPSLINGAPIVAILTGLERASKNPKTGAMAQLWILVDDQHPLEAISSETDEAICGDCKWRGHDGGQNRGCYVRVGQAPSQVWWKHLHGGYGKVDLDATLAALKASGRPIRLGAYGDPAALPLSLLRALVAHGNHTGYTHLWKQPRVQPYRDILMASVDSPEEFIQAQDLGWRTFRVRLQDEPLMRGLEITCPASEEAGHRTTCAVCSLCSGTACDSDRRKSIAIIAHGVGRKSIIQLRRSEGNG